jgi:hypothetical protein
VTNPHYRGPVRRVNAGKGHAYKDADGRRVPGVTTILSDGLPKKALINWAGNATADYAVDNWDMLSELKPSERLKKMQGGRYESRDAAANRGTAVHALAEKLIKGEEVEVPDALAGHVESYVRFLDEWAPEPVLVEAVVMSHKHGYAGTLDLIADIPGRGRVLMDIKTSRSGIFGETALQLCAYRYADVYLDETGDEPIEKDMLEVDEVIAIHVRADGYDLYPLTAGPAQLREFLYAREVARFSEENSRSYVGEALIPPQSRQRRRLELGDPFGANA